MVIVIKEAVWEQDDKYIFVSLPLRGASVKKLDVFSSEEYVKVSYPPYLWECFLAAKVYDNKSAVEVQDGFLMLKLVKQTEELWEDLAHHNSDDKQWQQQRRQEAIEHGQKRAEEESEKKSKAKQELGRFAVKKQMQLEDKERERIQTIKDSEVKQATEELEVWRQQQTELKQELVEDKDTKSKKSNNRKKKSAKKAIFDNEVPVRESGVIEVSFTPRIFPTPSRESTAHDEDEWLKKQAEARRIAQVDDADLTEEEKNPQFLKDKGDNFYRSGNYLAAINAYTHAIRMSPKMPSLYSNRAACHLKLGNMFKCIESCSKALDLLHPPVPQNAASRCKAFIRRGTAFCHLEMYVEGLMEYEAALKIDPNNAEVRADAEKIRKVIESDKLPGDSPADDSTAVQSC